ncbi:MAG: histidinol-phosphatase [Desulfotomaculaceae bacterium]|nr:histidinol-phosphatase [Desulfotomaculaceae bacterium]
MYDYHVHPGYSIDAEPSGIDEYCTKAAAIGITEVCFTTHLEVDPQRKHLDWFVRVDQRIVPMDDLVWLDVYFRDIENARRKWSARGLKIKAGLEVGYELGLEKVIERVVRGYPFDFVMGSVHCLDHLAISSYKESNLYFPGRQLKAVVGEYFRVLSEAVSSNLFDCIGHLDLYRRHGCRYWGADILHAHEEFAEPLLKSIAARGMSLEVNTSGLRRGLNDFHPSRDIIEMAVNLGVRLFTVGSDAHRLADLGHGLESALELLTGYGIGPVSYLLRQPVHGEEKGGQTPPLTIK